LGIGRHIEKSKRTNEEEKCAWEFAYHLIKKKSDEHRDNMAIKKHVFTLDALKASIISLVKKKKPEILNELLGAIK
jgi:hypothetical protein